MDVGGVSLSRWVGRRGGILKRRRMGSFVKVAGVVCIRIDGDLGEKRAWWAGHCWTKLEGKQTYRRGNMSEEMRCANSPMRVY